MAHFPQDRHYKRKYNRMMGPSSKAMKNGIEGFRMGEIVFAKHPELGRPMLGTITANFGHGRYAVVFLKNQEVEFANLKVQHIFQTCTHEDFKESDNVRAFYARTNEWKKARILQVEDGKCVIKFDTLDKEFNASFYHLKPELRPGESCFAYWNKTGKFLPATIEGHAENGQYHVQFLNKSQTFTMRADNILPSKQFEEKEHVSALWARDGRFYPAKITKVSDDHNVEIQFEHLEKAFQMQTTNLIRAAKRKRRLSVIARRFSTAAKTRNKQKSWG